MSAARTSDSKILPKYPAGPLGFSLKEEIGTGAFAKVYKASVCQIAWDGFAGEAKRRGAAEEALNILDKKGFLSDPKKLLEQTHQSVDVILHGESPSDTSKEAVRARTELAAKIIKAIEAARTDTETFVAVKILEAEHANWDDIRQELATMRSMNHGNVVRVHSAFVNELDKDQELWIVMPLLAVGSCSSVLREFFPKGIKDPKILATILHKVLKALTYFHKDGRIHRDVKAGNILLSEDGEVQLADFGVSANTIEHGTREATRKTFVGTPCWMAPEVMEQRNGYNTKADIWSFGITAMELAYGYAPYANENAMKVLVLTLKNPPPTCEVYPDYDNPKLPKTFHKMIAKCLVKDPTQRPDAKKMISHSFFKNKADSKYVVKNLIKGVMAKRKATSNASGSKELQRHHLPNAKNISTPLPVDSFSFPEGSKELDEFRDMRDKIKAGGDIGEGGGGEAGSSSAGAGAGAGAAAGGGDGDNVDAAGASADAAAGEKGKDGKVSGSGGGSGNLEGSNETKRIGRFTVVTPSAEASGKNQEPQPPPGERKKGRFTIKDRDSTNNTTGTGTPTAPAKTPNSAAAASAKADGAIKKVGRFIVKEKQPQNDEENNDGGRV
mmetsp:Transcript_31003/g.54404  ORF Transcript_31003/g.54404 Transcript_31003/m.54404 type:complete len:612 (+) Transcript_31003:95-1930(+)|eukprot:CAMPEP_0197526372 /NCGR_PEP_ID=MMETSP1318-20131121/17585_1 /TAXON_ID=552666 /ORGANISM="Partenskyella glossopodia, Strain RCC365" /LENGTH=611 /DNA_ID=CAMNT_0043080513 /DNA_START=80 /DNA_END=1915 /DNA_ORIENTATION=-